MKICPAVLFACASNCALHCERERETLYIKLRVCLFLAAAKFIINATPDSPAHMHMHIYIEPTLMTILDA